MSCDWSLAGSVLSIQTIVCSTRNTVKMLWIRIHSRCFQSRSSNSTRTCNERGKSSPLVHYTTQRTQRQAKTPPEPATNAGHHCYTEMSSENPTRTGNERWKSSPPSHDGNVKRKLHQNLQRTPVITATRKCQVKTLPELATNAGSHHRRHMMETSSKNSTRTCNERWRSSPLHGNVK